MELEIWRTRYREHLEVRGFSPRTVDTYTRELRPFFSFLEEQGVTSLAALNRELLEGYRAHLFYSRHPRRGHGLTLSTQSVRLGAIKRFVRFLVRSDYLLLDVGAEVEAPKVPRTLPRTLLSEDETRRLLEAPDLTSPLGIRDRTILEVLYCTGVRNSELCELLLDHLDFERRTLRVELGKGGKSRVVPLGEEAALWLEEYLARARPVLLTRAEERHVFLSRYGRPLHRDSLVLMVRRLACKAGIGKRVTPHVLRHSCATHMLRRGAGLRHLQKILGHASSATTERYTRVEVSDLRKVLRRCHPREKQWRG